jgi:hypothetical protein
VHATGQISSSNGSFHSSPEIGMVSPEPPGSQIAVRVDLSPTHRAEVLRSHDRMIGQYRREIKLYEATRASAREAAEKSPVQCPTSPEG